MNDAHDTNDITAARMLYQIVPGERVEYASRYGLEPGQSSEPEATALPVGYDVIIAVEGSGFVTWDDERVPIVPGMSVAVPPEATYTVTAHPDHRLEVMISGISSHSDPGRSQTPSD